ncbi:MAG: hypothetical protein LBU51_01390 [Bacteroidales bacterium]|nr:hypothetical protein [Bacteroidales bacterium]
MKKLFFFLLCSITIALNAQPFKVPDNIKEEVIFRDRFGSFYSIKDVVLSKYDKNGQFLYSYSDPMSGEISSVDVNNPMKIMLFCKEQGIIRFLDNRLAPLSENIDLYERQYTTISLAAYSSDNNIWLYDQANHNLIAIDLYGKQIAKIHCNFPDFHPIQLIEVPNKMLMMQNPKTGIFLFDLWGTYIKTLSIFSSESIYMTNNEIYYKDSEHHWQCYDFLRLQECK